MNAYTHTHTHVPEVLLRVSSMYIRYIHTNPYIHVSQLLLRLPSAYIYTHTTHTCPRCFFQCHRCFKPRTPTILWIISLRIFTRPSSPSICESRGSGHRSMRSAAARYVYLVCACMFSTILCGFWIFELSRTAVAVGALSLLALRLDSCFSASFECMYAHCTAVMHQCVLTCHVL
jgi:hypothetical protein